MANFNSFLKGLETNDSLRDYAHASRIFGSNALELTPRYRFLYHVFFELDAQQNFQDQKVLGLMVKSVDLPSFQIDTKTLNSYNRPNIVQSKIKYQPINVTFHDDSADVIRNFWYRYYSFYYRDSDFEPTAYQIQNKYDTNIIDRKLQGYTPLTDRKNFLSTIRIYSMSRKRAAEYILINPIITQFRHGQHESRTDNDMMEHVMTVEYETVKYRYIPTNQIPGFAEEAYYDQRPSPLTRGGATKSVLGPGGLLSSLDTINQDLAEGNLLSARRGIRATRRTFKNTSIKDIALTEIRGLTSDTLRGQNPLGRVQVPTVADLSRNTRGATTNINNSVRSNAVEIVDRSVYSEGALQEIFGPDSGI